MSMNNIDGKEQQPEGYYTSPQSHPEAQYPVQYFYGQLPFGQHTQSQYCDEPGYDQRKGQSMYTTQDQYQPYGANASFYSGEQLSDPDNPEGANGDKGLGSTIVGGAAGGYAGHKTGGGWKTAAGAAIGAIGMNVVSHKMRKPQHTAPVQQVPGQQVPVQQIAVPGIRGRIAQRRLARRGVMS